MLRLVLYTSLVCSCLADLVEIPAFSTAVSQCVYSGVDFRTQFSGEAYQPRGLSSDCASMCAEETLFHCEAYTWAGPGTHCILHGNLTTFSVTAKTGSKYNLTLVNCDSENPTPLRLCSWEDRGVSIALPAEHKLCGKMSQLECQIQCEMAVLMSCSSYGYDASIPFHKGTNCVLFTRSNSTTQLEEGNYQLTENRCRIKAEEIVEEQ